jgi:uncharacterized membrane protein
MKETLLTAAILYGLLAFAKTIFGEREALIMFVGMGLFVFTYSTIVMVWFVVNHWLDKSKEEIE